VYTAPDHPENLIAVARITGSDGRGGRFRVTVGGDGLAAIKPPLDIWLHRPAYRGNDLQRILDSVRPHPHSDGAFLRARLVFRSIKANRKGRVVLEGPDDTVFVPPVDSPDLDGWWLCLNQQQLAGPGPDVYVFQLIGLAVHAARGEQRDPEPLATVTGYIETGAHGVLETKTADGVEVLVPFVPEYTELDLDAGRVYVRDFADLIP
jgi:ribosomal 30S subunit maturation factor RimM